MNNNVIKQYLQKETGVNPLEREYDERDILNLLAKKDKKISILEEALEHIKENSDDKVVVFIARKALEVEFE